MLLSFVCVDSNSCKCQYMVAHDSSLLMKMALDLTIVTQAITNLDELYDVEMMLALSSLMSMSITIHSLIKFMQL